jgi:hypothetical protein
MTLRDELEKLVERWREEAMEPGLTVLQTAAAELAALLAREDAERRECNACDWRGPESECVMLGAVGPLCPECRETTEPSKVWCDCGDWYPPDSYGAGYIGALGRCPNCDAWGADTDEHEVEP